MKFETGQYFVGCSMSLELQIEHSHATNKVKLNSILGGFGLVITLPPPKTTNSWHPNLTALEASHNRMQQDSNTFFVSLPLVPDEI